ncbi:hypothetical protein [Ekhidna sp.]
MEIGYSFLEDLFAGLWELPEISVITTNVKYVLLGAVVIRLSYMLISNYTQVDGEKKFPLSTKGIIGVFGVIIAVMSYDYVLFFLDSILSTFFVNFPIWDNQAIVSFRPEFGGVEETRDLDVWGTLKMMGSRVVAVLTNPMYLISEVLIFLLWLVEYVIVGIFLGERFFVLLILKMIAPLVWSMSMFPRFTPLLYNWIKLYLMWYILILPYMIVNLLVNAINIAMGDSMQQMGINENLAQGMSVFLLPLSLLIIVIKFKLYATGKSLFKELITVSQTDDVVTE